MEVHNLIQTALSTQFGSVNGDTVGLGVTGDWVGSFKQSTEKRLSEQECIKINCNTIQNETNLGSRSFSWFI